MIILSVHAAFHDSGAALFDDYSLVAALQQERLTRRKGDGGVPFAAIAEVLGIAGLHRRQVDVLVLSRAQYPGRFFRSHPRGNDEDVIDLATRMAASASDAEAVFNVEAFRDELGLRPDVPVFFSNHHFAHGLPALFHTDWDDGLIYTADGCGDNVHYSQRTLKAGRLSCLFGDDRWLRIKRRVDSLGLAYGFATEAVGFSLNRHEGKLTGLAGFGQPVAAENIGRHFFVDDKGVIDSDFPSDRAMRAEILAIARGLAHGRRRGVGSGGARIRHADDSVRRLLEFHRLSHLCLAGGVFANVRLNRLLAESDRSGGDLHLSGAWGTKDCRLAAPWNISSAATGWTIG